MPKKAPRRSGRSASPTGRGSSAVPAVDAHAPCVIGVGQRTWHPDDVGEQGAPEPLAMWEEVARLAGDDTGVGPRVLDRLDRLQVRCCQTWRGGGPTAPG